MAREYKDSGTEWIGQIPREWSVELIGNNIKEINDKNDDSSEDNALQFKMGSIISKKGGDSKYNPESLAAYTKVKEGDIVINGLNLSFDLISQRVGLVREKGVITSTYLTLRPSSLLHSEFVNYLFKAYDNCKAFHGMGRGLRQILAYRELKNQKLIYPPLPEQQKIADYLDKVCGEVDEMVALQDTMLEELKAYKQSVITEAVTKGLNPNVPMRNSGIDWIGEVPEGWRICRLKFFCKYIKDGTHFSPTTVSEGYPYITATDVRGVGIDYSCAKRITRETFLDLQKAGCQPHKGDVLLVKDGATTGRVGMMVDDEECVLLSSVAMLSPNANILSSFLMYILMSSFMQSQIQLAMAGTALPRITLSKLVNFLGIFPPLSEQQAIASYLDSKCSEIDSLIAIKQQKIEELKDYKKSVIYEYVTGKKEVV